MPDSLLGLDSGKDAPGPCVAKKNVGVVEEGRDKVVVVGGDDREGRGKDRGRKMNKMLFQIPNSQFSASTFLMQFFFFIQYVI